MKKYLIAIIILLALLPIFPAKVVLAEDNSLGTDEVEEVINDQVRDLDFSAFEEILKNLNSKEYNIFGSESFLTKITKLISGENTVNFSSVLGCIFSLISQNITRILPLIASIAGIAILASIVMQTNTNSNKSLADIVHFVCYGFIIVLIFSAVMQLITLTTNTLGSLKAQMEIGFPILLTLMTALGSTVSVSVYQPAVAILSGGLMTFFTSIILPIFLFSLVFSIAGNISNNVKLNKFSNMFTSLFKWTIGLVFTIFSGFMAVQGITAGSYDGLSIRTAKYAMKSYLPFIGGYISDGLNLILTSSVLIKNAVGMAGLVLMFATVISPILQILIFKFGLMLVSSVLEPIADSRICNFLSGLAKSLSMLIATIVAVSFAYLITVGLIMCTSNVF